MTLVVEYLGCADLYLESSPGWWAAIVATYCPSGVVEHAKSKSTQPSRYPDAPLCRHSFAVDASYKRQHEIENLGIGSLNYFPINRISHKYLVVCIPYKP